MEFYHLNFFELDIQEGGEDIQLAAILAYQLPNTARVKREIDPDLAWSDETYMLARLDYDIRMFQYSFTEDAKNKKDPPKPIKTPREMREIQEQMESTDRDMVDEVLAKAGVLPL